MGKPRAADYARIIETERDIKAGVRALRRKCQVMRRVHDAAGDPPLRRQPAGLEGLARVIVAQQLSAASAGAIWARVAAAVVPVNADRLLAAREATLRSAGLSRPKIRTLRALAAAVADDGLDLDGLADAPDQDVHAALCAISGIGPWTADIYLMFCLGRTDAFAAGDLALQVAAQHAFERRERPDPAELLELAERWRPWRGVAARLLWAYYPVIKRQAAPAGARPRP
jgi:DNA-3-methyladenine glycosylase II